MIINKNLTSIGKNLNSSFPINENNCWTGPNWNKYAGLTVPVSDISKCAALWVTFSGTYRKLIMINI